MNFEEWNERMFKKHGAFEKRYMKGNAFLRHIELQRIRTVLKILNSSSKGSVLDVGCGDGTLIKKIKGKKIVGIDASKTAVKIARENLRGKRNVVIKRMNAERLDLPTESFDRIVCTEVLEHVQKPGDVISEMLRVLKKDGYAVITIPNEKNVKKIKNSLKRLGMMNVFLDGISKDCSEEWHIHEFSREMFKKLAEKKFRIEKTKAIPNFLVPIWFMFKCKPIKQ